MTTKATMKERVEGKTFGEWYVNVYIGYGKAIATCSCGKQKEVECKALLTNCSKSCGCAIGSHWQNKNKPMKQRPIESFDMDVLPDEESKQKYREMMRPVLSEYTLL